MKFSRFLSVSLLVAALISNTAGAQLASSGAGTSGPSYVGPGDVVSGAVVWWGLRAYNQTMAKAAAPAVRLRRASDNAEHDILVTAAGNIDTASAVTFGGVDATCTGTISSTTATLTSCSATPKANDTLTGAGITQPSWVSSCGTFTGGAGTCTLNAAQTVSVGESISFAVALWVHIAYDQSGNSVSNTQGTSGRQPQFLPSCINSLPCLSGTPAQGTNGLWNATLGSTHAQPVTLSWVGQRNGSFSSGSSILSTNNTGGFAGGPSDQFSSANTLTLAAGSQVGFTVAGMDGTWHAEQSVYNGASTTAYMDGTGHSLSPGTNATTVNPGWLNFGNGQWGCQCYTTEGGIWASGFNGTQQSSMNSNQHTYWGF